MAAWPTRSCAETESRSCRTLSLTRQYTHQNTCTLHRQVLSTKSARAMHSQILCRTCCMSCMRCTSLVCAAARVDNTWQHSIQSRPLGFPYAYVVKQAPGRINGLHPARWKPCPSRKTESNKKRHATAGHDSVQHTTVLRGTNRSTPPTN